MSIGSSSSGSVHSAGQQSARDKSHAMKWFTSCLNSKQQLRWVEATFIYQHRLADESWGGTPGVIETGMCLNQCRKVFARVGRFEDSED
jgi:hypothetical protein